MNASRPLVSVVMATFNRRTYLPAAIDSVLRQTVAELELVIADDGSDEATRELLRQLSADPRVRILWRPHCGNPAMVRNAALRETRGRYVAFQDSDDVWMPEKLARQLAMLAANPAVRWSYTGCAYIDAAGAGITPAGVAAWRPHQGAILDAVACLRAHSALPTVLVERTLLDEAGIFDEQLAAFEDHDLWLRLAQCSDVAVVSASLVQVRRHDEHYSGHDALVAAECRAIFLERAWRAPVSSAVRPELYRMRALQAGRLARLRALAGDRRAARDCLRSSLRAGWRYPRWWIDLAHAALPAASPRPPGTS